MKTPLLIGALALVAIGVAIFVVGAGGETVKKSDEIRAPKAEAVTSKPAPALALAPVAESAPTSMPASGPKLAPGQTVYKAENYKITQEAEYYIKYPDGRVEKRRGMLTATPTLRKAPIVQRQSKTGPKVDDEKAKPATKDAPVEEAPASQPGGSTTDH